MKNANGMNFISVVNFLLVFMPLLAPYRFPGTGINLQTLALFGLTCYTLFKKGFYFSFPNKYFKYFLIYALIVPFVGLSIYLNTSRFFSSFIPIATFSLAFLSIRKFLVFNTILRYYRKITYATLIVFFFQEITFRFLGWRVVGLLPFLPNTYEQVDMSDYITTFAQLERSSSVFLEPAHFAQYIIGYLCLRLAYLYYNNKILDIDVAVVTLALILSFSGSAYLLLSVILITYFYYCKITRMYKICIVLLFIAASSSMLFLYSQSEQGSRIIKRANSLSISLDENEADYGESEFVRIYRGWFVYQDMPYKYKCSGVGSAYVSSFIESSRWITMFNEDERYVNNAQVLMMGYGLIGTFLFMCFIICAFQANGIHSKLLFVAFITLCFFESFWCQPLMLIYLSIALVKYSNNRIDHENSVCFKG